MKYHQAVVKHPGAVSLMSHGNRLMMAGVMAKRDGEVSLGRGLVRLARRLHRAAEDLDLLALAGADGKEGR